VLTLEDRFRIAQDAATLDERLAHHRPAAHAVETPATARDSALLASWQRAFSGTDRDAFLRRLSWDGLDVHSVNQAAMAMPTLRTPPGWTSWLLRIGQQASSLSRELETMGAPSELGWLAATDGAEPPFVELWLPVTRAIHAELRYVGRRLVTDLPSTVRHGFERAWLADVAEAGALAAAAAFAGFDLPTSSTEPPHRPWDARSGPSARYDSFVSGQLRDGLSPLLRAYPVLARDLAHIAEAALVGSLELLQRLDADRTRLGDRFLRGADIGELTQLVSNLSDRHDGRRVASLTFTSGLRLIYKPRDVRVEAGFAALSQWLSEREGGTVACAETLPCEQYGWARFIDFEPCADDAAAERAFEAAGAQLCLAWLAGASDLHWHNVIATSRGPVLIDLETALSPGGRVGVTAAPLDSPPGRPEQSRRSTPAERPADEERGDECLTSGLLSCVQRGPDGEAMEVGGLRGRADRLPPVTTRQWYALRSDAIGSTIAARLRRAGVNAIVVAERPRDPGDFVDTLVAGYRRAYLTIAASRQQLLGANGLAARWFAGAASRVVLRATEQYGQALAVLREPPFLRLGTSRDIALDALNRGFSSEQQRPVLWPVAARERRALRALDVPRFTVRVDERYLREAREAGEVYAVSGLAELERRLTRMGDNQLANHERAIRAALASSPTTRYPGGRTSAREAAAGETDWIAGATWIADELLRQLNVTPTPQSSTPADAVRSSGLYEGRLGIAVFLAALGQHTGTAHYTDVALATLPEVLATIAMLERSSDTVPLGATSGIGSLAIGLTYLADWHGSLELRAAAERAAALLDADRIANSAEADVVSGVAGALLASLAHHQCLGDADSATRALAAGERLLQMARPRDGGRVWPDRGGRVRLGFAHGNSGIAYALARIAMASGDARFFAEAVAALAYERRFYSAAQRSWPVAAETAGAAAMWMNAWCYGAAGMTLPRLLIAQIVGGADLAGDASRAIEATLQAPPTMAEHLCCGTLGRAEILLTAAHWRADESLLTHSRRLAAGVLQRALARGHVTLSAPGFTYETSRPGLFQGLAGVGYHWLRQAAPDRWPSLLAFEPRPAAAVGGVDAVRHAER
jgi:type 2 lantibiotic biosynthesis protein LanM